MSSNLQRSFSASKPFSPAEIKEVIPYFQPIVKLGGDVVGFETLARRQDEAGTIQTPAKFMHRIAPENSSRFDMHMLEQACDFIKSCGNVDRLPVVNVNFTPSTLAEDGIADKIIECLENYGVPPQNIGVEITEQSFGSVQQEILNNVKQVSDAGLPIALDDFGSGNTNGERIKLLQGLLEKDVPLTVKLDMSIVKFQEWTASFSSVLKDNLFKKVQLVFEGITLNGIDILNDEIDSKLRAEDVKFQTFGLYKPMAKEAALDIVARQNRLAVAEPTQQTNIRVFT